jgi:hypothetical protein
MPPQSDQSTSHLPIRRAHNRAVELYRVQYGIRPAAAQIHKRVALVSH